MYLSRFSIYIETMYQITKAMNYLLRYKRVDAGSRTLRTRHSPYNPCSLVHTWICLEKHA